MILTLDVGCGNHPRGDVNIDYRKEWNPEIEQRKGKSVFVDVRGIPNLIIADALHLPFRDESFKKVFCFHVIEHVSNPYLLVQELLRVAKNEVEIRCPHRFSKDAKMPYHRHYFTKTWFTKMLKRYPHQIELTFWSPLREWFGLIRLPHEIRIKIEKASVIQKSRDVRPEKCDNITY